VFERCVCVLCPELEGRPCTAETDEGYEFCTRIARLQCSMPYLDRVFDAAREAVGAEGVAEVCESEGRRTKNGRRVKWAWACGWVARKRTTLEVGRVVALRDGDAAGLCGGKLFAFGGLRVCANTTRRLSSAVCVRLCV